ncbi:recombinase family protein [Nostoc sp. NIES-2111]
MANKALIQAVAYLRTSSGTNVGADKDSDKRQLAAIRKFAASAGYEIVGTYWDQDVRGADAIETRPAFAEMMERLLSNGCRTILVETASRFSRDLMTQEVGHRMLKGQGIDLIACDSPQAFVDDSPTTTLIRQVLGAVSQFEKAMLVQKLAGARARKKAATGKCGGRKNYAERDRDMVALARKLARYPVNGRNRSLREIAGELERQGYKSQVGTTFTPMAVKRMLDRPLPKAEHGRVTP